MSLLFDGWISQAVFEMTVFALLNSQNSLGHSRPSRTQLEDKTPEAPMSTAFVFPALALLRSQIDVPSAKGVHVGKSLG